MANHKSAEKRNRQSIRRKERNRANRATVKSATQNALEAIRKDAKAAVEVISASTSTIAKAARKGAIPKGRMARKVSRIQKMRNRTLAANA